jgi:hypothetical protein
MESRRLVVWIAAGILGFQGGTLILDLLNCSVLSWLYVRRYGLELTSSTTHNVAAPERDGPDPQLSSPLQAASGDQVPTDSSASAVNPQRQKPNSVDGKPATLMAPADATASHARATSSNRMSTALAPASAPSRSTPYDPTGVFCDRPRSRVDAAVSQGLSILAGLALGGSTGSGGKGDSP